MEGRMAERGTKSIGHRLAKVLRGRITARQYKDGFPTESELMNELGASRYAVRSALARLVADGLIERTAGRGTTIVGHPARNVPWVIRTVEDLIDRNLNTRTTLLAAAPIATSRFPEAATRFGLGMDAELFLVERLAETSAGDPLFYSLSFVPLEVGLSLPREPLTNQPVILIIEESRQIRAHRVRQTTAVQQPTARIAKVLGLASGENVITLCRTYFDRDGQVIVHGELHNRIAEFEQTIDFYRDDHPQADS